MAAPAAAADVSLVTLGATLSAQWNPLGTVEPQTQIRPVSGSAYRWPSSLGSAVGPLWGSNGQPCELEAGVWAVALAAAMVAVAVAASVVIIIHRSRAFRQAWY